MANFKSPYSFGDRVRLKSSGEAGTVRGVGFHVEGTHPTINIHYVDGTGVAGERWFSADLLERTPAPKAGKPAPAKPARKAA